MDPQGFGAPKLFIAVGVVVAKLAVPHLIPVRIMARKYAASPHWARC
jgi:hypothetical protein